MRLLQRVKTLLTGVAVALLLASTTFAEPAFAKNSGIHHGGKFHSDFYLDWGHGKGNHHHFKNRHFFGKKGFGHRKHKFSRNFGHSKKGVFKKRRGFGHSKKGVFKKHRGFNRSRSFGGRRGFGRSFRRH